MHQPVTSQLVRKRGRPAARSSSDTRASILHAARQCFAESGFTATTNNQIAEVAGVTASALYNHFSSKQDLYVAVCLEVEQEITAVHREAVEGFANTLDALINLIDKSIEMYEKNHVLSLFGSKVSMEIINNPELAMPLAEKILGGVKSIMMDLICTGQERGEISTEIPAEDIFNMYVSSTMGMAQSSAIYGKHFYLGSMNVLKQLLLDRVFVGTPTQN